MKALAERLYERAINYAREWFFSGDKEATPKEIFETVFWSEVTSNFTEEKEISDKFYAVFEAVADQLEEDGVARNIDLWTVVSPSFDAETSVVFIHKPTNKVLFFLSRKNWHIWDSPEELKEDLVEIYKVARDRLEKI